MRVLIKHNPLFSSSFQPGTFLSSDCDEECTCYPGGRLDCNAAPPCPVESTCQIMDGRHSCVCNYGWVMVNGECIGKVWFIYTSELMALCDGIKQNKLDNWQYWFLDISNQRKCFVVVVLFVLVLYFKNLQIVLITLRRKNDRWWYYPLMVCFKHILMM